MTHTPDAPEGPRFAQTYDEVSDALLSRWPETRLEPSLDRIEAFTELLGDPQRAYQVVHLTGTNGKTSTARMIDTLLQALDLRTGRFTSPHVEKMSERICLDGQPLSDEAFVEAFNDVAPYTHLVDSASEHPLSFFETVVGMAFAAFADAPVDVAVVEVGMGGSWDATNVADAQVAVVLPIALDHAKYLGETAVEIAREKAGIIKPGSHAVLAEQTPEVAAVLLERAAEVGATIVREGMEFGVISRVPAVGGQMVSIQGLRARFDDLFLPLHGAHQAQNAAVALASVEALLGESPLDEELVRAAFAAFTSPGRLEVVRRSPTVLLDAAHNPHGARATAAALEDSFAFEPLIGVIGVMNDKDYEGVVAAFEPHLEHLIVTQNSTPRSMSAESLGEIARGVFGEDRVTVVPDLADAIDRAATLAEAGQAFGGGLGAGAVLVTGSVVTVGEARAMLRRRDRTAGGSDD
ncbi:bifunctional folylpolyglutamate synthase/dihydrofolate synthase [Nocardioides jishulii]|uniref:Dihydrofolate synthase/folylpolyglutamate synthase n=1 Tax=Nocardioides jishulii TaxID=2575440 RepID=A0A4U2YJT3_9ACTN|nr:folylpolyglutamate synthase/dihydrofolate synthase family protein [Nocardioides jishulii]QCX26925.1 bifunctional folylpolyglutamate synthase/dihydrofolate synthase [Nocardioides jishulii]TKI61408.1 bifunctional folylpolyglutamate synthase/dihydrofolate synthase [Nocardioides jishulii]